MLINNQSLRPAIHLFDNVVLALVSLRIRAIHHIWSIDSVGDHKWWYIFAHSVLLVLLTKLADVECVRIYQDCVSLSSDFIYLNSFYKTFLPSKCLDKCSEELISSAPRCWMKDVPYGYNKIVL